MKSKDLLRELRSRVLAGEDRRKLFAEYHPRLPYSPKRLAGFMVSIVGPEEKRKYALWNGVLAALIGILALGKLVSLFSLSGDLPNLGWGTWGLWLVLGLFVPLAFIFEEPVLPHSPKGFLSISFDKVSHLLAISSFLYFIAKL